MADVPFATNLLPQYQSPQQMALSAAQTQNLQANAGYTQAQTTGQDIGNQGASLKFGLLQNYLQGQSANGPQSPASSPSPQIGSSGVNPDDVTGSAISQYAPLPTARPPSVTAQMFQATRAGLPDVAANIGAQYDQQVAGENQRRQLAANQSYQVAQQVDSAPEGAAFQVLDRYNPQAAAALKAKYPGDSADQLDEDVRTFAQHIGIATHQYTGRPTDFQNGVLVDKNDGGPVLGSKQVLTGLDAAGKEKAFASANEPVTVGDQLPQPRWQAAGFHSAESYVINADKAARSSAAAGPAAQTGPQSAPSSTPGPTSAASPPSAAPGAAPAVTTDPTLKTALADPAYKVQARPAPQNQSDLAANTDQAKATVQARTDLLKDSQEATSTAAQSLMYTKAAQALMASGGNVTGLGADTRAWVSRAAQSMGLTSGVNATNYQELAKYMGNAALQGAKQSYGSKMTESEVKLQMEELSPDVAKTPDAINHLLDNNAKNLQYTIDTARRTRPYLATGGDPQSFADWNQKYYPREKVVGGTTAAPVRPGQQTSGAPGMPSAGTVRGGYRFAGGDPSNRASWVKQ